MVELIFSILGVIVLLGVVWGALCMVTGEKNIGNTIMVNCFTAMVLFIILLSLFNLHGAGNGSLNEAVPMLDGLERYGNTSNFLKSNPAEFALNFVQLVTISLLVNYISSVWGGFSLDWYKTLFQRQDVIKAVWTTVRVTGISTLVSVSLATLGAIGFYKYDFKGKSLLDSMLYLPAVVPPLVLGIALFSLYNILHIQLGEPTIIIAHITFCTPFAFSTIKGTLDGFDHSIEEAARDLGCGQMQAILKVIVPNIMPGVLSAALMCVTISMDDVLTSYFVSGSGHNTLSMLIYSLVKKGVKPDINALSTIMIVLSVLLGLISQIAGSRSKGRSEE